MKEKIRRKLAPKNEASIEFEMLLNQYLRIQENDAAFSCFEAGVDYQKLSTDQRELVINELFN